MRKQQSVTDQRRLDLAAPAQPKPVPVPDEGEQEDEEEETQDLVAVLGGLSNEQYPD